jgi:hypothetical protein
MAMGEGLVVGVAGVKMSKMSMIQGGITDLDLDRAQIGERRGDGQAEVERDRLAQVGEGFVLDLTLTGDVDFKALSDVPVALTCDAGGECALHGIGVRT